MRTKSKVLTVVLIVGVALCWEGGIFAEEAEVSQNGSSQETEESGSTEQGDRPATQAQNPQMNPEALERIGRVEMVLLENADPESALDFAREAVNEDGESISLFMLMAASYMRLRQFDEAIQQFTRLLEMTETADPQVHLYVLYNIGRAHHGAQRTSEAVEAYSRYIAFARAHSDLASFIPETERLMTALRAQASR